MSDFRALGATSPWVELSSSLCGAARGFLCFLLSFIEL